MGKLAAAILLGLTVAGAPVLARGGESPGTERDTVGVGWVTIPGGEFTMGSKEQPNERPQHPVRLDGFLIAATEVTQAQWRAVMGTDPAHFAGCDDCPVETVSWEDATAFCARAAEMTGLPYRLPTEAEWEYAAGGGAAHQKWAGADAIGALGDAAWYDRNADRATHPVAQKRPNGFGLYDMSGNVAEWTADWYQADYYAGSPAENPKGPVEGRQRVVRGGSWWFSYLGARTSFRYFLEPGDSSYMIGFRPARDR